MAKRELNKKTSELLVTVVAKSAEWKAEQTKAFSELSKKLSLKGFRKGQVPKDMAKKHISGSDIQSKAIIKMLDKLVVEASKEIKKDELVLDSPTYKVDKISDAELEITFVYPMYPEVKLIDYKKLGIQYKETKPTPATVKKEIQKILESQAMLTVKDGVIAKGNVVKFDFEGFIGTKAFDGGKGENHELEVGTNQFIPGFEDQLIGLKAGTKKSIKVKFPADYHAEEVKGKEATFKVVIHEVKTKEVPELNDEFVKSSGVPNVKTVKELKDYILEVFTEQERQKARAEFQRATFDKMKKATEIAIPTSLVAKEMQTLSKQFVEQIEKQGMKPEQYMQMTGQNPAAMDAQFKTQAEARLKDSLIFAEIAKAEKIKLVDKDYENEYKKLAKVYGQSEDAIKGMINKQQMQIPMTNDRVVDALIKANKVSK